MQINDNQDKPNFIDVDVVGGEMKIERVVRDCIFIDECNVETLSTKPENLHF